MSDSPFDTTQPDNSIPDDSPQDSPNAPSLSTKTADAPKARAIVILGSVFVIATSGLGYELATAALSSYLMGSTVVRFSVIVGLFMTAMGLGSFLSKYISESHVASSFILIQVTVGLIGGASSLGMFVLFAYQPDNVWPAVIAACAVIGTLVGLEIPLMIRMMKSFGGVRSSVAHVLSADYIGALAAAILFPYLIVPKLGIVQGAFVFGFLNFLVAWVGLYTLKPLKRVSLTAACLTATIILAVLFIASERIIASSEARMYQDEIIFSEQTKFQKIVITRFGGDIRLYIDGHLQFSTIDEYRYHEALVHPAMAAAGQGRRSRVLILGGGDGLAAREVLKYDDVRSIDLVDLDPQIVELFSTHSLMRTLNDNSLNDTRLAFHQFIESTDSDERLRLIEKIDSPTARKILTHDILTDVNNDSLDSDKLAVHYLDALLFLERSAADANTPPWDVIIIDLPDPHANALARLYSTLFYSRIGRNLRPGGVFVTQASSFWYAPRTFWCIVKTIRSTRFTGDTPADIFHAVPYHAPVYSFGGSWGFVMASTRAIDPADLSIDVPTRYLNADTLHTMFTLPPDRVRITVDVNDINRLPLAKYYDEDWDAWHVANPEQDAQNATPANP